MTIESLLRAFGGPNGVVALETYVAAGGSVTWSDSSTGNSLLHIAAEVQDLDAIRALARYGADVNGQNSAGATPLHVAVDVDIDTLVQAGRPPEDLTFETALLLLSLGADDSVPDHKGETPATWAAAYGPAALSRYDSLTLAFRRR